MKRGKTGSSTVAAVGLLALTVHLCPCAYGLPSVIFPPAFFSFLDRPQEKAPESPESEGPAQKITFSGMFAGDLRWLKSGPAPPPGAGIVSSDFYIRMVDLAFEASYSEWLAATAVLTSEFLGDYLNPGDEKVNLDEVHLDILIPRTPLYIIMGKRTQPFGLFENYLLTDPLSQDAYETKKVGLTIGLKGLLDADLALTLYKGDEQMSHLFESGLFDATVIQRNPVSAPRRVGSYILSASVSPLKDRLTLFGAYLSEPGGSARNTTLNLGFSLAVPAFRNLIWEGEYMKALSRELYDQASRAYRESAFSMTVAYRFVLKARSHRGNANYRSRKSQIRSHPIEIAARYELFDDDSLSAEFRIWTARTRWSLGGRYTFYGKDNISLYAMGEYRRSGFRVPAASQEAGSKIQDELYLRLGVDF
jgi:hypothetical protein